MAKSGVEYLAQHPGWKTTKKSGKKKLFYVYFQSEASKARGLEPEFDGVIYLTEHQAGILKDMGYYDQEHGGDSEFEIHPVTPYTFIDVKKHLALFGPDEEPDYNARAWKTIAPKGKNNGKSNA